MSSSDSHFLKVREISSSAERQAYLERLGHEDPELRAQVERRLQISVDADIFFGTNDGLNPQDPVQRLPSLTGTVLGRYKILQSIGEGGMGVVYLAQQTEPVTRQVALKILKPGMDTRQVVARFEAERQALALMTHPNIAQVFDGGATDTGRPYFVMEHVRGLRITEYCDRRKLSLRARIELFITVCQAVQHAHQKGIIHRDLKPSNILVAESDGVPTPKIIDFGVAKATGRPLSDKTLFTAFLSLVGTPAYMSPEQADSSVEDIDTRSDIYSLGVLLYELLTGRTPFDSETLLKKGYQSVLQTLQNVDPPRPSQRFALLPESERSTIATFRGVAPSELPALLRTDLDWVVIRCLEKDRSRRYATANGLAADLERFLTDQPVLATPPSAADRFRKAYRRNRAWFNAGFTAALTLLTATMFSTWQAVRATRAERLETTLREAAQADRNRAEASAIEARRSSYFAEMGLAQSLWEEGDLDRVRRILRDNRHSPDRGFEWYYWMGRTHLDKAILSIPSFTLPALVVSPDGTRLAVAGDPDTLHLFRLPDHQRLWRVEVKSSQGIHALAFSPDGRELVSGDTDGTLRFHSVATGEERLKRPKHHPDGDSIEALAFAPDGKSLLVLPRYQTPWVVSADGLGDPKPLQKPNDFAPIALAVSPDGQWFADGGWKLIDVGAPNSGFLRIGRTSDHSMVGEFQSATGISNLVECLEFCRDSRQIVTGSGSGEALVHEVPSGRVVRRIQAHIGRLRCLRFTPDGRKLVTGGQDRRIRIWESSTLRELATFSGHSSPICGLAVSPDSQTLYSTGEDSTLRVWSLSTESLERAIPTPSITAVSDFPQQIDFAPDGASILSAVNGAWKWDVSKGAHQLSFGPLRGLLSAARFSPDGRKVLTVESDGSLALWAAEDARELLRVGSEQGTMHNACFLPDNQRLVIVGEGFVAVRDASDGSLLQRFEAHAVTGHEPIIRGLGVSADGRVVATGGRDRTVRIWDFEKGAEIQRLSGFSGSVYTLDVSPDGRWVVAGSVYPGPEVSLWDWRSGQVLWRSKPDARTLHQVRFTPDGRRILSIPDSAAAQLLDVQTGREVMRFKGGRSIYRAGAISRDGRSIALANHFQGEDHHIRYWNIPTPEECDAWLAVDDDLEATRSRQK